MRLFKRFFGRPKISIVVVVYQMAREAPRTLASLALPYQRDIAADDYEVIVVDNGSDPAFDEALVKEFGPQFRLLRFPPGNPSPVQAINQAVAQSRGEMVGVLIDGARICTPGLLAWALRVRKTFDDPVVATLNWHLGPDAQFKSIEDGYDQAVEDKLLEEADWEENGYALHRISALGGSSRSGYFRPCAESNGIFLRRQRFDDLGGYDEAFTSPGGGFSNLDFYRRACEAPGTQLVVLLGEGTFHQIHGGVMTNAKKREHEARWREYQEEHRRIRGGDYQRPNVYPAYMGHMPEDGIPVLLHSARKAHSHWKKKHQSPDGV